MNDLTINGALADELSLEDATKQVVKIQSLMGSLMKQGEHFGIIPGTDKPSLLKPGAEKLNFVFRLAPEYDVTRVDLPNGHREYSVKCILRHMGSGVAVGQGVGLCTSMESKYRWRKQYTETDVGAVTSEYWDIPKDDHATRDNFLVSKFGEGKYRTKKTPSGWRVLRVEGDGEKIENPDIADTYNTVLKMAKKRAFVDATITACAASDIFTQDIEDFSQGEMQETQSGVSKNNDIPKSKNTGKEDVPQSTDELLRILEDKLADKKIDRKLFDIWKDKLENSKSNIPAIAAAINNL